MACREPITLAWSGLTRRRATSTAVNPAAPGRPIRKVTPSTIARFMYAGLNQQITRHADDPLRGMSVSLSGSLSDQRSNYIHSAVAASMRYRGLFDARPEDWIGFGLTWIDMSSHYARNQRYMNQISGATDYNDPAYQPVAGHSLNGELYYRFRPVSAGAAAGPAVLAPSGRRRADPGRVGSGVENRRDLLIVAILITFFHLSG